MAGIGMRQKTFYENSSPQVLGECTAGLEGGNKADYCGSSRNAKIVVVVVVAVVVVVVEYNTFYIIIMVGADVPRTR